MANVYYTVKKGDTLTAIAIKYNTTVTMIAQLNNIKDVNKIYVGQKLLISGVKPGSSSSSTKQVTIEHFGLQADTDRTVFVTWKWSMSNTDHYRVRWHYYTKDLVSFVGSDSTTTDKQSTYDAPSNAVRVSVYVMPVAKTRTVNNKEVAYWTAEFSPQKVYYFSSNPPSTPPTPTVEINNLTLKAEIDNLDVNATSIQFQIVKDNSTVFKTGTGAIKTSYASYSCAVNAGGEYKVRCRAVRDKLYSNWSEYSSPVGTAPSVPKISSYKASSSTSVSLSWNKPATATGYDIEYATKKTYFDKTDQTSVVSDVKTTSYELIGLETGNEYFFRVRAKNENGESGWSSIVSVVAGKAPSAPTTWSSSTTVTTGDNLTLYWIHNSVDGSSQTYAELELNIGGKTEVKTIQNSTDEDEKDKTSFYVIDTSVYSVGTKILWRVRTRGVLATYGDWSIQRTVDIYAPATLSLQITNKGGDPIETVEAFPFYVSATPGPSTQTPVSYHVSVISNSSYETVDNVGNAQMVSEGEEVFSRYFNHNTALLFELSANNIRLENSIEYTVICVVSMSSGLTATDTATFTISWSDNEHTPSAEIGINDDDLSAYIKPYCIGLADVCKRVNLVDGKYVMTDEVITVSDGTPLENSLTEDGEQVYFANVSTGIVYYCVVPGGETFLNNVTLSVYRREFDGTFTEIAKNLQNVEGTFVTDPHPALDYARYRIVSTENDTGAIGYYDVPGYPIGEKAIVIQWNEEWSNFDAPTEDALVEPPWSGSLLKLPYNIDVDEKNDPDVELVQYIGRKHSVSYYGTQLNQTATWKVAVVKSDEETIYALRRLANYMGDVYVREPSGVGYWANIKVSFSQTHMELTIPVTLTISRVEGGI